MLVSVFVVVVVVFTALQLKSAVFSSNIISSSNISSSESNIINMPPRVTTRSKSSTRANTNSDPSAQSGQSKTSVKTNSDIISSESNITSIGGAPLKTSKTANMSRGGQSQPTPETDSDFPLFEISSPEIPFTTASPIGTEINIVSMFEFLANKIANIEKRVLCQNVNENNSSSIEKQLIALNSKVDALLAENLLLRTKNDKLQKHIDDLKSSYKQQPNPTLHLHSEELIETVQPHNRSTPETVAKKSWSDIVGSCGRASKILARAPIKTSEGFRVRATDADKDILSELNKLKIPEGVRIIQNIPLKDGSRFIKTSDPEAIKSIIGGSCNLSIQERKARIKVFDVPKFIKEEELIALMEAEGKVISTHEIPQQEKKHVIVEVDKQSYKRLIAAKYLPMGRWIPSCKMVTSTDAQKCGLCQQYGHRTQKCHKYGDEESENIKSTVCGFCANSGHHTFHCPDKSNGEKHRCINCLVRNLPNVNHTTASDKCPVKLRFIQNRLRNTNY